VADVFSKAKRSLVMAAIHSTGNKDTEMFLARILRRHKIIGWRRHIPITGKPDFVFQKQRLVVFVDGCFWHGCPKHGRNPKTNQGYWRKKMAGNKKRDRLVKNFLKNAKWKVLRIWEHELKWPDRVAKKILRALENHPKKNLERKRILGWNAVIDDFDCT
jgi:DNA mismatch endonuclease, patch repair protein